VTAAPAVLAGLIVPAGGLAGALLSVLCAVLLSLAFAAAESQIWKRVHGARGLIYSDLMLWGFARRLWAERRVKQLGAAYRAAVGSDGVVRVELLEGLGRLLEVRNPYTYGHCRRVARHAERIARTMRLGPNEVAEIRTAALVHDVGKIYTPVEVLHKEGPLDDEEFEIVKRHAVDGADMLAPVRDPKLVDIVRHHHERLDGSGYPDGLSGEQIPLGARIIAVADTFDAITSHRPYRRARSQREALGVLEAEAGRLLDAASVEAFARGCSPRRSIASVSLAGAVSARIADALQLLPGGLLGGASVAGILPAAGAAGLLAVTPGVRYERAARAAANQPASALGAAFPGALEGAQQGAPVGGAPTAGNGHVRVVPVPRRTAGGAPASPIPLPGTEPGTGGGATTQPSSSGSTPPAGGGGPVSSLPRETPSVETPSLPPGKVPPVTVPPLKIPPVSVPPVTTPQVGAGPVTVPSVTVPSVTLKAPNVPGVSLPGGGSSPGS
jgi:putative nucleotidyltransferase with HDIG domain